MADENRKKKTTVFDKLDKIITRSGIEPSREKLAGSSNQYKIGDEILAKTKSKEEWEKKKKEHQQNKYLSNLWRVIDNEKSQGNMQYESTRIAAYSDYENMEWYPEISATLDIMMEEASTPNHNGELLNIYSQSDRVKKILKDLFFNRMDIHTNLPMWIRNVCKYGDNFVFLSIDGNRGVNGVRQLPNYEIERREGDLYNTLMGQGQTKISTEEEESEHEQSVKFHWKGRDINFNSWQVAHFRLLSDDRRLPYGCCLKYNTRVETKNGYKEIQNIEKGDEVCSFDTTSQEKKITKVLDTVNSGKKKTYKISTKHNFIDASEEHKILYYDVNAKDFKHKNTLDLKIGDKLVINKKKTDNNQVKIDKTKPENNKNGYWNNIDLVPDIVDEDFANLFGYMIGDGWIHNDGVEIALSEHPSLNEKYVEYLKSITGRDVKYTNDDKSILEHSQARFNSKMLSTVLKRMGFKGNVYNKRIPEWVFAASPEIRWEFLKGIIDADGSLFIDEWDCLRYSIEMANEELINDIKILVQSLGLKSGKICTRKRTEIREIRRGQTPVSNFNRSYYFYFYGSELEQTKKHDINHRISNNFVIEPITSIEESGEHETYDIHVEDENHNFYGNGIVVHNSVLDKARRIWKQLLLCVTKDTKVWTPEGHREIKDIKKGDTVYSFDPESSELVETKVKTCWKTGDDREIYKVKTDNTYVEVTDNHPIMVKNGDAISYKNINEIDLEKDEVFLPLNDGLNEKINSIDYVKNDEVWDLEVDHELHNFIANGMVVHNSEDAMLVYRVSRAPERRVFKIYVGNLDNEDVEPFVNDMANRFKRKPMVDPETGQLDLNYNQLPVWKNTPIPLLDGRTLKISELAKEYDEGKTNWVYSVNDKTNEIVAGKVDWCGKNYTSDKLIKVWLDDETWIKTAPEHPFILRDGSEKFAEDLEDGDSLMPFYFQENNGRIYDPALGKFVNSLDEEKEVDELAEPIHENHKVTKVETIEANDDVYCMTVVGPNGEDDRHNFAVCSLNEDQTFSRNGVFVKNSSDQDYFIPVRSEDSPNPIETLPGAQNLDEIADIEYLQRKLFTALRVPKTFLGFEEPQGEGKNLALQDIRFSRTINRIQQSIIQELNKVAIVHLYLMGFEDELDNFTITMNNPSTQAEMLKVEHYQQKISAYKDAVADPGNGFGAMSMTRAKKEILGMSDDQIKHDLLEQRMESAAAAELNNTAEIIKHTGLFDDVDQIYGDIEKAKTEGTGAGQDEGGDSPEAGGGGGGISPQDFEFGAEEEGGEETEGGEGEEDLTALGAEEEGAAEEGGEETEEGGEEEPTEENKYKNPEKLLQEQKEKYVKELKKKKNKYAGIMFDKLIELSDNHGDKSPNRGKTAKMQDKNFKINEGVDNMINDIDDHLTKDEENNEEEDE